jgi:hypothetical protein
MASSSASEPLIRPEDRSKPPSSVQLGSNLVFPLVESSDVRLDLVPWVGADGVVFICAARRSTLALKLMVLLMHVGFVGAVFVLDPTPDRRIHEEPWYHSHPI